MHQTNDPFELVTDND